MIFLIVMILCLAYYAVMYLYAGTLLSFSWFWLVIGVVSGVIHVALKMFGREALVEKLSLPVVVSFWTTVGVIAVLAVIIGVSVMTGMFSRKEPGTLDYIIVLGTRVDEDKPSKSLCYRLDKAIEYLETDENLNVIVTGGQSKGADVTEAYAMTATVEEIPYAVLHKITARITAEVEGINRVLYDLTPKPVGTIEWE